MTVTVAIDSFKGSLTSRMAGDAVRDGIFSVYPDAVVHVRSLADGGEGTVDAIAAARGGRICKVKVTGPLGEPVDAEYGIIDKERTAIMEMSSSSGITLVPPNKRNPYYTTTYGFGELIRHAIVESGCRRLILGIGGSATNDGGVGMLTALGFGMLDADGEDIPLGAIGLSRLVRISAESVLPELSECEFIIACDVKNPLLGKSGASFVFGPQKGAAPEQVEAMDGWLKNYADLTYKTLGKDCRDTDGAGAAGGLGFALFTYLGGRSESGISLVIRETGLEAFVRESDIVVTGEGRLDGQSVMGKAPVGVAALAKKYGKPVVAFSGCATDDARLCNSHGIDAFFPIPRGPMTLAEAMDVDNAYSNLRATAEQAFRLFKVASEQGSDK